MEALCAEGGGFVRTGPFGSQLHQSDYVADPNAIPVVMPKDMVNGRIDQESVARITEQTAERLAHHLAAPGDIILSRRGDVGRSISIRQSDIPVLVGTGSIRIHLGTPASMIARYFEYFMRSRHVVDYLEGQAVGATMPNLNAGIVKSLPVLIPPLDHQRTTAETLGSIDDLIENSRQRIELLELMSQAIYQEWFVNFRYPGREEANLVDSPLGPIPRGWEVTTVASLAANERNAVTGGPFGSKLGRRDYIEAGIPVIRGTNLRVGGGFDESDFVFVSDKKANELRSSEAHSGDVLITQRGTLGQVGLIPELSRFDRYILSQSQMKITVDRDQATPEFLYAQFRTPSTMERFVARAMSSGVPHVNLKMLREFHLLNPPVGLQQHFSDLTASLNAQTHSARSHAKTLTQIGKLLLPKLVTGEIDVSQLDLDALVGSGS